jgi:hypothetical protein
VQRALFDMGFVWRADDERHRRDGKRKAELCHPIYIPNSYYIVVHYSEMNLTFHLEYHEQDYSEITSSGFFATYAGHIERFPDYEPTIRNIPNEMKLENPIPIEELIKEDTIELKVSLGNWKAGDKITIREFINESEKMAKQFLKKKSKDKLICDFFKEAIDILDKGLE